MKKFLVEKPLHSFLVGVYIVSVIYVQNIDKVLFSSISRSLIVAVLVSALIFGVAYLIFRSARKAGIFTTFVVIGLFTYGYIYDQLEGLYYKGMWPFSHIHRFLISGYLIFYLVLLLFFLRSKRPHYNLNFTFNCLVVFVLFINIVAAVFSPKTSVTRLTNPFLQDSLVIKPVQQTIVNKPDVYYIILDGFASESVLKKYYGSQNNVLYDYLREKGFYVGDSSKTNYPATIESLSSSMNMNYLDAVKGANSYGLVQKNAVAHIFKSLGYQIQHIESGYSITNNLELADLTVKLPSFNEFENRLLNLTILRLDDLFGTRYFNTLKYQFDRLSKLTTPGQPKFNFIHIVSPHPPFVVDSAGNRKVRSSLSDLAWEPRENYLQQLKYISRKISSFIDSVLSIKGMQSVILLQSDHGPWMNDEELNVYDARVGILNAYYVPDSLKQNLYKSITPVNSFRLIFSEVFNLPYQLLADRPLSLQEARKLVAFKAYAR